MLGGARDMQSAMDATFLPGGAPSTSAPGKGGKGKGGVPGMPPPPPQKKEKRVAGMKKQTQSKIHFISGKLTDLKVLRNKVENAPLSLVKQLNLQTRLLFLYPIISIYLYIYRVTWRHGSLMVNPHRSY
jgi:hypothetical protein